MPDFSPIITEAYQEILKRNSDPTGLANYNRLMNQLMSESKNPRVASPKPNILGGHAAGLKTILVKTGKYAFDDPGSIGGQPDWTLESIA